MSQPPTPPQPSAYPPPPQAGGFAQPPAGQPAFTPPYAPMTPVGTTPLLPEPQRSSALGVVALVISIVAAVGATLLSAIAGFAAAEGAMRHAIGISPEGLEHFRPEELLSLLSPVRDLVLWAEIGFWAGTLLGVWALVQGIVAIVTRRGRGAGIAAVVIAALGPALFFGIVYSVIATGVVTGATTY